MRLILLPAYPAETNGYGIAVKKDLKKLNPGKDDIILWYVNTCKDMPENNYCIKRYGKFSYKRILNFLKGQHTTELFLSDLENIDLYRIDEVFCGEVVFYRALRKVFPDKRLTVRFHNSYSRINDRVNLIGNSKQLSLLYKINLKVFTKLEKQIFRDKNTYKVFISDEDRDYYTSNFGRYNDSEVWGFSPSMELINSNREDLSNITKIVWFGGLDSHKKDSVIWFTQSVFPKIRERHKNVEFHLYGSGTKAFDDRTKGIIGHGFYEGTGMPYKNNALYINPDLTGGGVKIKLLSYFENGLTFLTTPFGYEGYPKDLIDNKYCFVEEPDNWCEFISNYLKEHSSPNNVM